MAKYEKFEKWMLHAPVVTSNGKEGVVADHRHGAVYIDFKDGTALWWLLRDVEFLEESLPNEEDQTQTDPIPWEEGQVVWDVAYGKGEVVRVGEGVHVKFKSDNTTYTFTANGSYDNESVRSLFFSEPTIIADTMPPKKPFVPKLEEGDEVLVVTDLGEKGQRVVRETEDMLYTVLTDYKKSEILAVYRIGEEVKFQ